MECGKRNLQHAVILLSQCDLIVEYYSQLVVEVCLYGVVGGVSLGHRDEAGKQFGCFACMLLKTRFGGGNRKLGCAPNNPEPTRPAKSFRHPT